MRIGEYQTLVVDRDSPHGFFLTDGEEDVLLPKNQVPDSAMIGDPLEVFVYTDSEDRPIATLKEPFAQVGQFANLEVVSVTPAGAFLDWGLDKDLFCAIREQRLPMQVGERWVVRVYFDQVSQRVACSARVGKFLEKEGFDLKVGQRVEMIVYDFGRNWTDVILDDRYKASIFPDEWVEEMELGEIRPAYVKQVRSQDGRIAVSLRPQSFEAVRNEGETLLRLMRSNGGSLRLSDRSSPEEIQRTIGLSKGAFKKLIGSLYKEGKIVLEADRIRLA